MHKYIYICIYRHIHIHIYIHGQCVHVHCYIQFDRQLRHHRNTAGQAQHFDVGCLGEGFAVAEYPQTFWNIHVPKALKHGINPCLTTAGRSGMCLLKWGSIPLFMANIYGKHDDHTWLDWVLSQFSCTKPNFPCMPWLRPLLTRSCALTLIWLPTLQKSRPSKWKLSFWSRKIASLAEVPLSKQGIGRGWSRQSPEPSQITTSPPPPHLFFGNSFVVAQSHPGTSSPDRHNQHRQHHQISSASSASSASSDLLSTYLPIPHTPLLYHTFLLLPLPS